MSSNDSSGASDLLEQLIGGERLAERDFDLGKLVPRKRPLDVKVGDIGN